jgi:hypothetical protein
LAEAPENLLERAAELYRSGCAGHRDAMLEVGRLLHAYVLAVLAEGDGVPARERYARGLVRDKAVKAAAARLGGDVQAVSRCLCTAMAAELLSAAGNVGSLSWDSLRLFTPFVRRRGTSKAQPGRKGVPASRAEEWEVRPAFGTQARRVFAEAVAGGWGPWRVREETLRVRAAAGPIRGGTGAYPRRPTLRQQTAVDTLRRSAAAAAQGDLVEMLVSLAEKAADPVAVAEQVLERLEERRARKRPSLYAEAGA